MPELPEVETVCRGLAAAMEGRRLVHVAQNRPDLRFAFPGDFVASLTGRRVLAMTRRAKYILTYLEDGPVLIMHLGMSGRFTVEHDGSAARPGRFHQQVAAGGAHEHVVFTLDNGDRVVYADPRRFGFMALAERETLDESPFLRDLGVEPLGNELTPAYVATAFAGRRTSLKAALLDQRLIAGIGNIYACEALHRARLSPRRAAASLSTVAGTPGVRAERLVAAVRQVLDEAIAAGGSSLRDYAHTDGELGYFQHAFAVYDRAGAPCPRPGCGGTVRRIVQGARSTFYCPVCQR